MSDKYAKIIEHITAADPVAALADLAKLATEHAGNPAATKLVTIVTNYLQGVVNESARKTFADALVGSGAFVRVSETRIAEKPMSANTYVFYANDNALEVLNTALKALPRWREKAAHDDLVKQWMRVPQTAGDVGDADAVSTYDDRAALRVQLQKVGDDVGFPLSESLKAAVFSAGWIRRITYDAASGVLAAGRSPEGFAAMVAAAAPECRKRALGTVVLTSTDFARLTSANPDYDFVTFADVQLGVPGAAVAFGYLRDAPCFRRAAVVVAQYLPMFGVFGVEVVAKALAAEAKSPVGTPVETGESVALRVGNTTSNDSFSVVRLWDTAQKLWNDANPNRLGGSVIRPIYGIPEWTLSRVDHHMVDRDIARATRINWAPSA